MRLLKKLLTLCAFLPILATAQPASTSPNVDVGVYINRIDNLSYSKGTFVADMTIWFRWDNPNLHPNKTFAIKGATINSRRDEYDGLIAGTDVRWAAVDVVATIPNKFNVNKFPFDSQRLLIRIEEVEQNTDTVNYRLDTNSIKINPNLDIQGWAVDGDQATITYNTYPTDFGYSFGKTEGAFTSSQFNYELLISHTSPLSGIKLIFAPVVAILILLFTSLLPVSQSARFGAGTTAIFALVSSHYLILNQLPETSHITLAEQIVAFGLLQSLIYFVVTVFSYNAQDRGNTPLHQRIDRCLAIYLAATVLCFAVYVVKTAIN